MKTEKLNTSNRVYTSASDTTFYIDYCNEKNVLEVSFFGGHTYQYFNVEPSVWEKYKNILLSGGSSGTFVNTVIKPKYRFKKID